MLATWSTLLAVDWVSVKPTRYNLDLPYCSYNSDTLIGRGVTRIYDWGPLLVSRLPMLMQLKSVLSAYCTPILAHFKRVFNLQIGGPRKAGIFYH